jgi:IS30 family transposase
MAQEHSSTNARTFKHLSDAERGELFAYQTIGLSMREIARKMNRNVSTISRELKRGMVQQMNSQRNYYTKYYPDAGSRIYKENRENCGAHSCAMKAWEFLRFAEKKILEDKWSPDAVVGYAKTNPKYKETYIPCTKTVYNLIDEGKLSVINLDLAMKTRRSTKKKHSRKNKRILGQSIEERDPAIDNREEFGHWEIDTVIGKKTNDEALLTLIERKTRKEFICRLPGKNAPSVEEALKKLFEQYKGSVSNVFKSITTDNGSEFSDLGTLGEQEDIAVYFSHPYASYERGTNERHNGMIRRFIKKGQPIHTYSDEKLSNVETWMNELPRKILGYQTPNQAFASCVSEVA